MVVVLLILALACFVVEAVRARSLVCAGLALLTLAFLWPHLSQLH